MFDFIFLDNQSFSSIYLHYSLCSPSTGLLPTLSQGQSKFDPANVNTSRSGIQHHMRCSQNNGFFVIFQAPIPHKQTYRLSSALSVSHKNAGVIIGDIRLYNSAVSAAIVRIQYSGWSCWPVPTGPAGRIFCSGRAGSPAIFMVVFPIQSQWERSRANNSVVKSPTRPKFELIRDFMPVLIICKFDKDPIKGDWENAETPFFLLHVDGNFLLPWNHGFDPICPKA